MQRRPGPASYTEFNDANSDAHQMVVPGRTCPVAAPCLLATGHVDAALEVRAVGDGNSRCCNVSFDRPLLLDFDLLSSGQVTDHLTEDDDRFCGDLSLDLPIRSDREHVIAKLDLALDSTFDRQVLAAAQFAFDKDAFPNARAIFANDEALSIASRFVHGPLPSLCLIESKRRCRRGFNRFPCQARQRLGSMSGEAPAFSLPHQMPPPSQCLSVQSLWVATRVPPGVRALKHA